MENYLEVFTRASHDEINRYVQILRTNAGSNPNSSEITNYIGLFSKFFNESFQLMGLNDLEEKIKEFNRDEMGLLKHGVSRIIIRAELTLNTTGRSISDLKEVLDIREFGGDLVTSMTSEDLDKVYEKTQGMYPVWVLLSMIDWVSLLVAR